MPKLPLRKEVDPNLIAIASEKELTLDFLTEVVADDLNRKRFGF